MRIPDIQARLREIALETGIDELDELAGHLSRRPPVMKSKPRSAKMTEKLRADIKEFHANWPQASQLMIARHFNVNPGRVSEVLAGFRA